MKKLIAIALTLVLVMMATTAMTISPAAAQEGPWITAGAPTDDDVYYTPDAGYHYTDNGFETISPDYTGMAPYQQARTRDAVDLKADNDGKGNSVSLKMTILEYAYDGPDHNKDQWICITINSQPDAYPGSVDHGEGICILFRRNSYAYDLDPGQTQVESFYVDKEGKNFSLLPFETPVIDVPINDLGQEVYEFTLKYTEAGYSYSINGYEFPCDDYLNRLFDRACKDGAYIGITIQTGYEASPISFAINEWQGAKPVGDDYQAPQDPPVLPEPTTEEKTVVEDTTEYRTEDWIETENWIDQEETIWQTELETVPSYPDQTVLPDIEYFVTEIETYKESYHDVPMNSYFLGNGLVAEIFGNCNSVIAAPIITLFICLGAAFAFKKKD